MATPQIHLVEGPVGAGKSTYCMSLATRRSGVHIALDEWFARLFSPDRPTSDVVPWYLHRKERLLNHIWSHAQSLVASGASPILELGLVQRQSREEFYQRARDAGIELKVYVLEASREVRRKRVQRRNVEKGVTFSMVVPERIFEIASDMWQSPDEVEMSENRIELISTEPGASDT
ncbi:MAG: ATP-binding protein [Casimicrobium sp.]